MRVLMVHNRYRSMLPGGEDIVFDAETELLRSKGHAVEVYERRSDEISNLGALAKAAIGTVWNSSSVRALLSMVETFEPKVVHFHNTFPLISPAAVRAVHDAHCAVVMTLHNYRLFCASSTLFRDGEVCERCLGRFPVAALRYGCYRGSRTATVPLTAMQVVHNLARTWHDKVHRFIALTEFERHKVIEGGLPREKVLVKPNFMREIPFLAGENKGYVLFLGRFTEEKGIKVLLKAWRLLEGVPLKIAGEGPLSPWVRDQLNASRTNDIEVLGMRSLSECLELLRHCRFLVFPSVWYETFGLAIRDAFASGKPVVASRIGGPADIVEDGVTGILCPPGNARALANAVSWALSHEQEMVGMGQKAREVFERRFTAEANYPLLLKVYEEACEAAQIESCA